MPAVVKGRRTGRPLDASATRARYARPTSTVLGMKLSFASPCTDRGDTRVAALPSYHSAGSAGDAAPTVPRRRSRFFRSMSAHPKLWCFFFDLFASESPAATPPSAASRSPPCSSWPVPSGARVRRSRFYRWMFSPVLHPLLRGALACVPARAMRAARLHHAYATCATSTSATASPASSWTSAGSTPASSHGARVAPTPSWVAAEEARHVATPSSVAAEEAPATEEPAPTTGSRKPCPPSGRGSFIQSMSAPYFQQFAADRAEEAAAGRVFRGGTWKPAPA